MLKLLLIIGLIFGYSYWRKKLEEKKWAMNVPKTDNVRPYPHGFGESVMEYEYHLFDNFVKATWPRNFQRWEPLDRGGICCNFTGPHHIMVYHTDGTYHDEVVRVFKSAPGDEEYGNTYRFEVRGLKKAEKCGEEEQKPEITKNFVEVKQTQPEITPKEDAPEEDSPAQWVKEHKDWIEKKLSESWFVIPYGSGKDEIPEAQKEAYYHHLNNLNISQPEIGKEGIELYPLPEI